MSMNALTKITRKTHREAQTAITVGNRRTQESWELRAILAKIHEPRVPTRVRNNKPTECELFR